MTDNIENPIDDVYFPSYSDTVDVPAINLPELQEKIEKLNKRAIKLGVPEIKLTIIGDKIIDGPKTIMVDGKRQREKIQAYTIKIEGEAPKLSGWTPVAALDFIGDDVLVREFPNETVPVEYRNSVGNCDHCGINRRRNNTFVLRDQNGKHVEVGRSCLKDFLGHTDPKHILWISSLLPVLDGMIKQSQEISDGGSPRKSLNLLHYLSYVAATIRTHGWVPRSMANEHNMATSDLALNYIWSPKDWLKENTPIHPTEDDINLAKESIEWAAKLDGKTSYEHNISVIARNPTHPVNMKSIGLAASIIIAFQKHHEREFKRQEIQRKNQDQNKIRSETSDYIGQKGDKIITKVRLISPIRDISRMYPKYVYRFEDENGNILVWFGSVFNEMEMNQWYTIKATVDAHDQYNGVKQTLLKRVSIQN